MVRFFLTHSLTHSLKTLTLSLFVLSGILCRPMVSFGDPGVPIEWFHIDEIVDPLIDQPDPNLIRVILKVPDIPEYWDDAGDDFMIFGCDLVNGEMFREGCDEDIIDPWCGYWEPDEGEPYLQSKRNWTEAQVKFLFSHNINTIGSRSSFDATANRSGITRMRNFDTTTKEVPVTVWLRVISDITGQDHQSFYIKWLITSFPNTNTMEVILIITLIHSFHTLRTCISLIL